MTNTFVTAALATVSLVAAAVAGVPTQAAPRGLDTALTVQGDAQLIQVQNRRCFPGERSADCRERMRVEQRSHRRYVYRYGRYVDESGAAVAGAILGFALGAAIAGSQDDYTYYHSHRNDRGWRTRCQSAYSGFDYRTGTYRGNDGYRHYCTR